MKTVFIDSSNIKEGNDEYNKLEDLDCILVPGGFGERGTEGKILAIKKCREKKIPFLGICYGMQMACIEYARNVAGVEAFHEEITPEKQDSEYIIHLMREFLDREGHLQKRTEESNKGGSQRVGGYICSVEPDTLLHKLMGKEKIMERHRHRYEFNNEFSSIIEK